MSLTPTSSAAPAQAVPASQSSSVQTFSGESEDPIETAISGLTSLVDAGRSAADTGRSPAANYIQGAMDLYASMEETEALSLEELKERLRLSEDPLIRDLADDSVFLGKMDVAGTGPETDGKVSKSAVGDFLMNAYERVSNILNNELTEGDYDDLRVLAAEDAALGQGILGELTRDQREDLSHRIAEDPELIEENTLVLVGPSGYNFEEARARARELAPDADAELQKEIAHILYGSVSSVDYTALKKLFAEDPSLGARVLEEIAPQQAQISERLSRDSELRKNPEDWSEGYRSLMGNALPASRQLLMTRPPVTPEDVGTLKNAMLHELRQMRPLMATLKEIIRTGDTENHPDLPASSVEHVAAAVDLHDDFRVLFDAALNAGIALENAVRNGLPEEIRNAFDTLQQALGDLQAKVNGPAAAFMDSVAETRRAAGQQAPPSPDPDQAGPSGLRRIDWTPDGGVTRVAFLAQSQSELEQELVEDSTFREFVALEWPGWALGTVAAHLAYQLWNGKGLPRV